MTTIQEDKLEQRQKIFCLQNLFYSVYPIMNVVRERRRWRYQLHRQRPPMVSEIRVGWRVATISLSTHDSLPDTTHLCPCDHTWPAKKSSRGDQNKNRFTGIHFQFLKFVVSAKGSFSYNAYHHQRTLRTRSLFFPLPNWYLCR